ncbi:MAG: aminopeptidase P family protein [Rickettsiales bacterium]|nr:aminopeptidase P family protein [Rickettsiales bacterium]
MISKLKNILSDKINEAVFINTKDPFLSEYSKEGFNLLEKFTNFSGSNGYLLLTKNHQFFITDGRYLKQAEDQFGNEMQIFDLQNIKKITLDENLKVNFPALQFSISEIEFFKKNLNQNISFVPQDIKFFDTTNPKLNFISDISLIDDINSGKSLDDKIEDLISLIDLGPDEIYISCDNSSISWLLNVRSLDVAFNPVLCSYLIVSKDKIRLFADFKDHKKIISNSEKFEIEIISKQNLFDVISQLSKFNQKVKCDPKITNYFFKDAFGEENLIYINDVIIDLKSVKNDVEIKNIKQAHIEDGIALTKFLYWLDSQTDKSKLSELDLIHKLATYRINSLNYMGPSFHTICGFASNGAIIHYKASEETNKYLNEDSVVLIDSGGQYLYGTTDVTRTIAIGKPPEEIKRNFTLVLKGHIALSKLRFPKNNTGAALDSIARQFLWLNGLDYAHGTGHGVGYYLNVHEGPQSISPKSTSKLKSRMVLSNEPGYYKNNHYGIRIENLELVKDSQNDFLEFETLTLAPIDKSLIDIKLLNPDEIRWYNDYHDKILTALKSSLDQNELNWLKNHKL